MKEEDYEAHHGSLKDAYQRDRKTSQDEQDPALAENVGKGRERIDFLLVLRLKKLENTLRFAPMHWISFQIKSIIY